MLLNCVAWEVLVGAGFPKIRILYIFVLISITQGFQGGSNPRTHFNGSKGRPRFQKPWFADHEIELAKSI